MQSPLTRGAVKNSGMRRVSSVNGLVNAYPPASTITEPAYEIFVSGPVAGLCRMTSPLPENVHPNPNPMSRSVSAPSLVDLDNDGDLVTAATCLATPTDGECETRSCNARTWFGGDRTQLPPDLHERFLRTRRRRKQRHRWGGGHLP